MGRVLVRYTPNLYEDIHLRKVIGIGIFGIMNLKAFLEMSVSLSNHFLCLNLIPDLNPFRLALNSTKAPLFSLREGVEVSNFLARMSVLSRSLLSSVIIWHVIIAVTLITSLENAH
jgi:hypothetical protein